MDGRASLFQFGFNSVIGYNRGYQKRLRGIHIPKPLVYGVRPAMTPIIPSKPCIKCGQDFPATNEYFHKSKSCTSGIVNICKGCHNKANKQWRESHPEQMREYQNTYVDKHPEKVKQSKQEYYEKNADKLYLKAKRHRENSPDKYAAHTAVSTAMRNGVLPPIKECKCQKCDKQAQHYHHWSYEPEHWLDVIPLCATCHRKEHL